jgi:hypothetical protein
MPPTTADLTMLEKVLELISRRTDTYETGVQTTVCWNSESGWLNSITRFQFIRKGENPPSEIAYEYPNLHIIRRLLGPESTASVLKGLVENQCLRLGEHHNPLKYDGRFSVGATVIGGTNRQRHSEWSQWPADIFELEPNNVYGQNWPPDQPLIQMNAPYYPSLEHVLFDVLGIRVQGWTHYLRGQVMIVLPDFRARISKLTVALKYLRAEVDCAFLPVPDLMMKTYAESRTALLVHATTRLQEPFVQFDLLDRPSFVGTALICASTGDILDERTFREGVSSREPNVVVEPVTTEIEQLLLTGEGETVEFKEKLDPSSSRLVKTAVAFANTRGGTVVFGVDDDQRSVGCDVQGMAERITSILRSRCDPPPQFTTKVVKHEGKELFLVQIAESSATVHVVKELGPFIRANRSNRTPTSHELELMMGRRGSGAPLSLFYRRRDSSS